MPNITVMQKLLLLLASFLFLACSSAPPSYPTTAKNRSLMTDMDKHVAGMTIENCLASTADLRAHIRRVDFQKNTMDQTLQSHLFQMRLKIKNIYAESAQKKSANACALSVKQTLSDLRTLEEALGFNQSPVVSGRGLASLPTATSKMYDSGEGAKGVGYLAEEVTKSSVFTDSDRQMVTNAQSKADAVTSLMDLKTGDILLLHRLSQTTKVAGSPDVMNWTDIVVVYRDSADDLFLLTAESDKIRMRTWRQTSSWLKRNVDRLQILRPQVKVNVEAAVEKMQNRKLKHVYAFGDLIKKELKIQTSTTVVSGLGATVLGEDLEMSPDLLILSEWKDYSAAYKTRALTKLSEIPLPSTTEIRVQLPRSRSQSRTRPLCETVETVH